MKEKLEAFLLKIPENQKTMSSKYIDYFTYFLTVIEENLAVQPADIDDCFSLTRIDKYSNIPSYLNRHTKKIVIKGLSI